MRALCVGRHKYLSEHLGRFFDELGLDTECVVGMEAALAAARRDPLPDVVLCDYDLLATGPIETWESEPRFDRVPVIAVSLTRRPDEVHLLDVNGIGGFLYLPKLGRDDALRLIAGVRRPLTLPADFKLPSTLEWARSTTSAP